MATPNPSPPRPPMLRPHSWSAPATPAPTNTEVTTPTLITLQKPLNKKNSKSTKFILKFWSVFRSFPIIQPKSSCRMPSGGNRIGDTHIHGGVKLTGTLFGYRKTRINLVIQENPRSLPVLVLELSIQTGKLLHDMGKGLVRIALECEKKPAGKIKIVDEPIWTLYCNGRKSGYAVKRNPTEEDLMVMQLLQAVSMGAGVLPSENMDGVDGDFTYMRMNFERVTNSRDSETYYMMNPDGNNGPELSIFFVRI